MFHCCEFFSNVDSWTNTRRNPVAQEISRLHVDSGSRTQIAPLMSHRKDPSVAGGVAIMISMTWNTGMQSSDRKWQHKLGRRTNNSSSITGTLQVQRLEHTNISPTKFIWTTIKHGVISPADTDNVIRVPYPLVLLIFHKKLSMFYCVYVMGYQGLSNTAASHQPIRMSLLIKLIITQTTLSYVDLVS